MKEKPPVPKLNFNRDVAKFLPRQMEVVRALAAFYKYILYGGAVGGGKSYLLRWIAVKILMKAFIKYQIRGCQVMLACEDYPALKDRQISKIVREFPKWLGTYHDDHKAFGKCFILSPEYGDGVICLRNLDDASKYQSAEFAAILVDELTKNPYAVFNDLRLRLRWPGIPDNECPFIGATNPGGVGHAYCKAFWIDKIYPPEFITPIDFRSAFMFIPSKGDDNPYIDQAYWQGLNTLPEQLRKAFRDGSWEIFLGQAFEFGSVHITKELPIPQGAQIYTTFDWGFGAPFSWGWWWVDADGRGFRFSEFYGWNGTPNQGLRWVDSRVADEIVKRETVLSERYGIDFSRAIRKAGPDCFQKKPDYKGGGQGPSTAEVFTSRKIYLTPGDASRTLKLRQFRERLKVPKDAEGKQNGLPMLMVYEECDQFIRTIPSISTHQIKLEEVDPKCEDHQFDEACHFCMARPLALSLPAPKKLLSDAHIDLTEKPQGDSYEQFAVIEQQQDQAFWDNIQPKEGGYYSDVDGR